VRWTEWLRVLFTLGAAAAEIVRERRRAGDTRPAKVIWSEVKSARVADDAARERREAFAREAARHGADFGERDDE